MLLAYRRARVTQLPLLRRTCSARQTLLQRARASGLLEAAHREDRTRETVVGTRLLLVDHCQTPWPGATYRERVTPLPSPIRLLFCVPGARSARRSAVARSGMDRSDSAPFALCTLAEGDEPLPKGPSIVAVDRVTSISRDARYRPRTRFRRAKGPESYNAKGPRGASARLRRW